MEQFANPKLQKLYEALMDLFPDRVGWQDIGDEDELISVVINIDSNTDEEINTTEMLWITPNEINIYGYPITEMSDDDFVAFHFEK